MLPALLAVVLVVAWIVAEWKAPRRARVALGLAMAVTIYYAALTMFHFSKYVDDRQSRACLQAIRQSLRQGRLEEVERALDAFEAEARAGHPEGRYALCDELEAIAREGKTQPK
jgi:O-antigen ligase